MSPFENMKPENGVILNNNLLTSHIQDVSDFAKYDSEDFNLTYDTDLESPGIKGFPTMFIPHLIKYGTIQALTEYYHYTLREDEDVEIAAGYLGTLKEMKDNYEKLFITKDVLVNDMKTGSENNQQRGG